MITTGELVLDRYRVVEQIASGGHSVVFRGADERLNRPVCIKVFSGLGGESGVGRTSYEHFVQEAFALSRLTHPNTLRIYDFGHLGAKEATGMPLQVCEYMNGGTLSQVIRERGTQSAVETGKLVLAMCAALGEAHGLGIVHRDIKPQNILFGTVGGTRLPKLADFGIAKWSDDDEGRKPNQRADDTAVVAGQKLAMYSPSWAAPEQLAGQPVSPATDIYSLAAVAVYMLSTKAVFADEDVYAGYKKRRHAGGLIRDALAPHGVPKPVVELLIKALAFDPKERPKNVDEMVAELMAVLEPTGSATASPFAVDTDVLDPDVPVRPGRPVTMSDLPTPPMPEKALRTAAAEQADARIAAAKAAEPEPQPQPASQPEPGSAPALPPPPPASAALEPPTIRQQPQTSGAGAGSSPSPSSNEGVAPGFVTGPPQAPPQPGVWTPPVVVPPWMVPVGKPSGQALRLVLTDSPAHIAERRVHFIHSPTQHVDLVGRSNQKVRVTIMPSPTGRIVHLKGMTCFVAFIGGRPSPAVTLERPADIALVTPRAEEVGHIRVSFGKSGNGNTQTAFSLGAGIVALSMDDCADPILFDFGPGSEAYFVYTRGRPVPPSYGQKPRR